MAAMPPALPVDGGISPLSWIMAGSNVLGKALSPAAAGPSSANSVFGTNLSFDNSGWNVAMGGSKVDSEASKNTDQGTGGMQDQTAVLMRYGFIFLGVVMVWKLVKKS